MNFHDDNEKAFKPLLDHCKGNEDIMRAYMYMFHDDEGVHHYKHIGDREYIQLAYTGNLLKGNVKGWSEF